MCFTAFKEESIAVVACKKKKRSLYQKRLNYNFNISSAQNNSYIEILGINLSDQTAILQLYKSFLENDFSFVSNMPLKVNFTSGYMINNKYVNISDDYFSMDLSDVVKVEIYSRVTDNIDLNHTDWPGLSSGIYVDVTIKDSTGNEVLHRTTQQDLSIVNSAFEARYNQSDPSGVAIQFSNGSLIVDSNLSVVIEKLILTFINNDTVTVTTGWYSLPPFLNIKKESTILLIKG